MLWQENLCPWDQLNLQSPWKIDKDSQGNFHLGKDQEKSQVGGLAMRLTRLAPALAAGLLMLAVLRAAGPLPTDHRVQEAVDKRVTEWWPKPEEKRFDQIGWAADIRTARKLAAEHNRPLFLFTMDGRVNLGRC
jgi:hypothetical protein